MQCISDCPVKMYIVQRFDDLKKDRPRDYKYQVVLYQITKTVREFVLPSANFKRNLSLHQLRKSEVRTFCILYNIPREYFFSAEVCDTN